MKILHIDNCPKNAALIKATFDKDTVHHVQTGSQALEKLDLYKYNIIIMETCLDTVNGYQLMKHIRRFDKEIPILVLSFRTMVLDKFMAIRHGATDYMTKPTDKQQLLFRMKYYRK